jgi:hypothetical protein
VLVFFLFRVLTLWHSAKSFFAECPKKKHSAKSLALGKDLFPVVSGTKPERATQRAKQKQQKKCDA